MDMRYLDYLGPGTNYYEKNTREEEALNFKIEKEQLDWSAWVEEFDEHWAYQTYKDARLPIQGWKIHITANLKEAQQILDIVATHLLEKKISFKYVKNYWQLYLKNSKYGDRSSSGKFMTIYPPDEATFLILLEELSDCLKDTPKGPFVLNDKRWRDSNVYFRYGGFAKMEVVIDGKEVMAIKTPEGNFIEDLRVPYYDVPEFIHEPSRIAEIEKDYEQEDDENSAFNQYEVLNSLHFSNGGGVYKAKEKKSGKFVILKEGRPGAGLDGDKRDAVERIEHETNMLQQLKGVAGVVEHIETFKAWEHIFIVEEFVEGMSLDHWLPIRYPFENGGEEQKYGETCVNILEKIEKILTEVHKRGIGIGDFQPANVMITDEDDVVLIDFEVADELTSEKIIGLKTPGFSTNQVNTREKHDWFAFYRLAIYLFLPAGPVLDLSEELAEKHLIWIQRQYGNNVVKVLKRIADNCFSKITLAPETELNKPQLFFEKNHLQDVVSRLRAGILMDIQSNEKLLPGDIRQNFMTGGKYNVMTGGLGILMALNRTGDIPQTARDWLAAYCTINNLKTLDNGLFNGKAGAVGVLYECGEEEKAFALLETISLVEVKDDITLESGLSGIGLTYLSLYTLTEKAYFLEKSIEIALQIKTLLEKGTAVVVKDMDTVPIGLINGWTSAAFYFTSLFKVTENPTWLTLAIKALEKDIDQCVFDDYGNFFVKDRTRTLPYLSGGSAGIGMVLAQLQPYLEAGKWQAEFDGLSQICDAKCYYNVGLFRGLAGLIALNNVMICLTDKKTYEDLLIETLNIYILENEGRYYCPGDFCYRLSGDIFSGAAGVLLSINETVNKTCFSWLPLPNVEKLTFLYK